jgi:hypothetical protein
MVVQTANEAVGNADAYGSCEPGMCLKYVRTWLEIGSSAADAIGAWNAAKHRHPGDKHPPKGAPVFWKSGSGGSGHGHIAIVRGGNMRSTDIPSSGKVGNDDGSWPRIHWGQTYLGWTEDLNGILIPYLRPAEADWRASGEVYVEKLHQHQQDSQSVSRLRWRLEHHPDLPNSHDPGLGTASTTGATYGIEVLEAVRYWQRNICAADVPGPRDGTSMSNAQANRLFGEAYEVIEE